MLLAEISGMYGINVLYFTYVSREVMLWFVECDLMSRNKDDFSWWFLFWKTQHFWAVTNYFIFSNGDTDVQGKQRFQQPLGLEKDL